MPGMLPKLYNNHKTNLSNQVRVSHKLSNNILPKSLSLSTSFQTTPKAWLSYTPFISITKLFNTMNKFENQFGFKKYFSNIIRPEDKDIESSKSFQALIDRYTNEELKSIADKNGNSLLHIAAERGYIDQALSLIKKGLPVNSINLDGQTPLHHAIRMGINNNTDLMLLQNGANVKAVDFGGMSLLHSACMFDRNEIISSLIIRGADVNSQNKAGVTPLHFACEHGNSSDVELLVRKGAEINAIDNSGLTPLMDAIKRAKNIDTAVVSNTESLESIKIIKFLLENGAATNIVDENDRVLWNAVGYAIIYRAADALTALLENGAKYDHQAISYIKSSKLTGVDQDILNILRIYPIIEKLYSSNDEFKKLVGEIDKITDAKSMLKNNIKHVTDFMVSKHLLGDDINSEAVADQIKYATKESTKEFFEILFFKCINPMKSRTLDNCKNNEDDDATVSLGSSTLTLWGRDAEDYKAKISFEKMHIESLIQKLQQDTSKAPAQQKTESSCNKDLRDWHTESGLSMIFNDDGEGMPHERSLIGYEGVSPDNSLAGW